MTGMQALGDPAPAVCGKSAHAHLANVPSARAGRRRDEAAGPAGSLAIVSLPLSPVPSRQSGLSPPIALLALRGGAAKDFRQWRERS